MDKMKQPKWQTGKNGQNRQNDQNGQNGQHWLGRANNDNPSQMQGPGSCDFYNFHE